MSRPYDNKLFIDTYEAVASGPTRDRDGEKLDYADLEGRTLEELKAKLTEIFDRIYDEGLEEGRAENLHD